jgi:hypothetical protein
MCETHKRQSDLTAFLLQKYGPVLGQDALSKVLNYASTDAFERSVQRGYLKLKLTRMPGRRGLFALADDVAAYLVETFTGDGEAPTGERSDRKTDEQKN